MQFVVASLPLVVTIIYQSAEIVYGRFACRVFPCWTTEFDPAVFGATNAVAINLLPSHVSLHNAHRLPFVVMPWYAWNLCIMVHQWLIRGLRVVFPTSPHSSLLAPRSYLTIPPDVDVPSLADPPVSSCHMSFIKRRLTSAVDVAKLV